MAKSDNCGTLDLMPKRKGKSKDIDDLAIATEKAFQFIQKNMATKEDLKQVATKDDLKRFATKEDLKRFATKEDLKELEDRLTAKMATKEDLKETEDRIEAKIENREADLQGVHEDELAGVEGKKEAPVQWKSMPRRLKTVEQDVEKIKDYLHLPSKT